MHIQLRRSQWLEGFFPDKVDPKSFSILAIMLLCVLAFFINRVTLFFFNRLLTKLWKELAKEDPLGDA